MTHVKQQRLWLKAKFYFTTVIYKFTHIKVKVSSLAKLHSHVKVLEFAQLAVSPLYNQFVPYVSKVKCRIYFKI